MSSSRAETSERLIDEIGAFLRRNRTSGTLVAQSCGLQPTQVQILFALRRIGECRVATLAETQIVDPSVASRQVASLEKLGLVDRRTDPEDGRAALVSLTETGHAKLREVRRRHADVITTALQDWPVERITRFAEDLGEFVAASSPFYDELAGPRAGGMEVV
ncbi:hypothetical protein GCM10023169_27870 [Georgenia halophila]|uniref:HTH marR-type domain-containing protein n=1 Tax=Georgenia halophila TaxID=620889 RepID=A0ABP8LFY6_9MICO